MKRSLLDVLLPELKQNKEPKPIDTTSSQTIAKPTVIGSARVEKFVTVFDNFNTLNDMVVDKAHRLLKDDIEDSKRRIKNIMNGEKPNHFTQEEWEKHKSLGQRLMNL